MINNVLPCDRRGCSTSESDDALRGQHVGGLGCVDRLHEEIATLTRQLAESEDRWLALNEEVNEAE